MKITILFLITFFSINSSLKAQTINGIPLNNLEEEYLMLTPRGAKIGSRKIQLLIDFGQETRPLSNMEQLLLDSTGKKMEFNSDIHALNFMYKNGYELIQQYGLLETNGIESVSYFMRKRKKD